LYFATMMYIIYLTSRSGVVEGGVMARRGAPRSPKLDALKAAGTLHPRPQDVTDSLFRESPFFDPHDMVQVKYEMLRRVRLEARRVSEAAADFGFSRPSFYAARAAFQRGGLPGLLPQKRGPRQPHKLTDDVLAVIATARTDEGMVPRTTALAALLKDRFGITAHPRSIERSVLRYLHRQEKKRRERNRARRSIPPGTPRSTKRSGPR
jgi:hypothetical protein